MSSRREQKEAARAARIEAQHQAEVQAARRRQLGLLGGLLALAAAIVVVVLVASGGGSDKSTSSVPKGGQAAGHGAEAYQLLGGIPERGVALGKPGAPLTLVEFNDMQCPVCREYASAVFPTLVRKYVRTGKLRMEFRLQSFIGPDSVKGGKAVWAASQQDKAWMFQDIFYANQGTENTGYVTDDFLKSIARATPGMDVARLFKDMKAPGAEQALKSGDAALKAAGFSGTPSFLIGKTGGAMSPLKYTQLTPDQFTGAIDSLLR